MFPTHVGMNRPPLDPSPRRVRVPHARGDEPSTQRDEPIHRVVFPTHVGMNRDLSSR